VAQGGRQGSTRQRWKRPFDFPILTRLAHYRPGEQVTVLVARRDRLQRLAVTCGAEPPKYWQLEVHPDATVAQRARVVAWLGCLSTTVPAL
jgi:predicted metalloprotease with PDZ domain